ncbi:MAG: hypothetical protein H7A52_12365 [Akkermansiaceae bacterium]|nr:hypothetical protein [Akkermansiaceae bacterium]
MNPKFVPIAFSFVLALPTLAAAEEPVSTQELTDLLASGRFREAVAQVEAIPSNARPEDPVWRFLAEAAWDFARLARAEAVGTGRFPDGKRVKAFGGAYYALLPLDTDLEEAKALAASVGGRLVEIRSEEEQRFLVDQLILPTANALGGVVGAWTGIENSEPGDKDSWHLSDGSPITYARWANGEPDGNDGESVAVVLFSDAGGQWRDASVGNYGGSTGMKAPLIQWMRLPVDSEEKPVSLAEAATAPILGMAELPSFDELREKAVKAIGDQCLTPNEVAFSDLISGYRRALDAAEKDATGRGELEEVVAIRAEKRLAESWKSLADGAEISSQSLNPGLEGLRGKLVENVTGLLRKRSEAIVPLISTYRDALGGIESELTVAYRIDDALAIRGLRNELAALIGEEAQAIARPMAAKGAKPAAAPKFPLQLDIPKRNWPTRSYDPGRPGKLNGFGKVWPGDTDVDLTRAEGITDFVKVALLDDGWIALRADGTLVSTRDKLNGMTGIWRMIPREDGALLFHEDDTFTIDDSGPIRHNGISIPAREVVVASHCNGGGIATMKDGRALLWGEGFTQEERTAIEKAFAGVTAHAPYRYGVWGAKPEGGVVVACLGEATRLKKEGGVRLPEVEAKSSRAKIVEVRSGIRETPMLLTDEGEVLNTIGGWFPKRVSTEPFGAAMDASMKKNAVAIWNGPRVKVVLSNTGRWQVANLYEQDRGRFARELESRLQGASGPIKDLAIGTRWEDDKGKGFAFALWIE